MSNKINKKKKSIPGSTAAAIGVIAAICFCVLFVIFRATGAGAYTESEEARNGAQYLSSIEGRDVKAIADRIGQSAKAQKSGDAAGKLDALGSDETDMWSLFDGIVLVGDSRTQSFSEYGYLPESIVVAELGANLKYADEVIDEVAAKQPSSLIFTYGINDVDGNWHSAEDFIEHYKEILGIYRSKLPNTDIYVCSIIPVKDIAVEEDSHLADVPEYAAAVRQMCEDEGYIFIDCDSLFDYDEYYEGDGIHFTSQMYPIWGEILLRKVFENESGQSAEANG